MLKVLIPQGRKQRLVKEKKYSCFFLLLRVMLAIKRPIQNLAAPTELATIISPTAIPAPTLLLLMAVLAAFFVSALFRIR